MPTKTLQSRITLKYDSYENWLASTFVPLAGEACIATVATKPDGVHVQPTVLIKIGNGVDKYSALPFIHALAADVVQAAKSEQGLTNFVQNLITNGKFASAADLEALTGRVSTAEGEIDGLQALVGSESVATQIQNAISALALEDNFDAKGSAAAVQGDLNSYKTTNNAAVKANTDAIAAIKDSATLDSFKDIEDALATKQAAGDYATRTEAQGYANAVLGAEADDSAAKTV